MNDKQQKGEFTKVEIASQVDSWEKIYEKIQSGGFGSAGQALTDDLDSIILFGCGSSYNLAMSAAFFTNNITKYEAIAVPSSELLYNKDTYLRKGKKYLLVGFSRSGETTESINVVKNLKDIPNLIFTCHEENSLTDISKYSFYCDGAEEKSVVMTKSFSSMLFAYCLLLANINGINDIEKGFKELVDYMKIKMPDLFDLLNGFVSGNDFMKFFSLGSGFNYGMAVEADLKIKEMTQIPSYSYHVMEFNHGPKSLVDENGLVLFMTINKYFTESIYTMFKDFTGLGAKIVVIGKKGDTGEITRFLTDEDFKSDLVRAFINIPVFQVMSYYKTLSLGLDPDKPRNLDYTTKMN